jgi:hypothetical protein
LPPLHRPFAPLARETAARHGRPARLPELASGSGEPTSALARLARRKRLPVEITGSDYIPKYIDAGNALAKKKGLSVSFRHINAFDMADVLDGAFDIVFISQSIHHFTAGQLAMMAAQARRAATTAFVGFDGYRGPMLLAALPLFRALPLRPSFAHDGWIMARRLFSMAELDIIARIAAPGCRHWCGHHPPGVSSLIIRFDRDADTAGRISEGGGQ